MESRKRTIPKNSNLNEDEKLVRVNSPLQIPPETLAVAEDFLNRYLEDRRQKSKLEKDRYDDIKKLIGDLKKISTTNEFFEIIYELNTEANTAKATWVKNSLSFWILHGVRSLLIDYIRIQQPDLYQAEISYLKNEYENAIKVTVEVKEKNLNSDVETEQEKSWLIKLCLLEDKQTILRHAENQHLFNANDYPDKNRQETFFEGQDVLIHYPLHLQPHLCKIIYYFGIMSNDHVSFEQYIKDSTYHLINKASITSKTLFDPKYDYTSTLELVDSKIRRTQNQSLTTKIAATAADIAHSTTQAAYTTATYVGSFFSSSEPAAPPLPVTPSTANNN